MRIQCLKSSPRRCLQLTPSQDHDLHDPQFAADQPWDVDGAIERPRCASFTQSDHRLIRIDTVISSIGDDSCTLMWYEASLPVPLGRRPAVKMSTAHDYMPSLTTQKDCSFVYAVCWSPAVPKLDSSGIAPYLLVTNYCCLLSFMIYQVLKSYQAFLVSTNRHHYHC